MQDLESKQFLEGVTFQGKKKKKTDKTRRRKNKWTKDEPGRDLCKDSAVAWILSDFKSGLQNRRISVAFCNRPEASAKSGAKCESFAFKRQLTRPEKSGNSNSMTSMTKPC